MRERVRRPLADPIPVDRPIQRTPLHLGSVLADTEGMAGGTVKQGTSPLGQAHEEVRAAARVRSPAGLRVTATLLADALALAAVSVLVSRVAVDFQTVPGLGRLFSAFPTAAHEDVLTLVALIPWWLFVLYAFGLYREPSRSIGGSSLDDALKGLTALTAGSWGALVLAVLVRGAHAPVATLVVFWVAAAVAVPAARWAVRKTVWSRPQFTERTLIIGAGEVGHMLAAKIARHPEYRLRLVGFLDDGEPRGHGPGPVVPVVGSLHDLHRVIAEQDVTRVIVAFSKARHPQFLNVVRTCADMNVTVNIVPRLFEVVSSRAGVDDIEGIPLLDVGHVELSRFNMLVKRVFDLVVAGFITLLVSPFLIVISVLIKLDSPGPVFFRQERMGRDGRTFHIFKFRSMKVGAERLRNELEALNEYSGPMFKIKKDPRLTRVGPWLRKWSLDELPQLLNVLRGEMSLVGPRPLWIEEAKQCTGWTQKRLNIMPGITGLWQVLGRSDIPFDEMVKLDYMYVTKWSLSWDVTLLLETIPAVLEKRGAY